MGNDIPIPSRFDFKSKDKVNNTFVGVKYDDCDKRIKVAEGTFKFYNNEEHVLHGYGKKYYDYWDYFLRGEEGKYYWSSEKIKSEGTFCNGELHGEGKEYYFNGNIKFDGIFLYGRLSGKGTTYSEDGEVIEHGYYQGGVLIKKLESDVV